MTITVSHRDTKITKGLGVLVASEFLVFFVPSWLSFFVVFVVESVRRT